MKRPKTPRTEGEALAYGEIQALYTIPELAELARISRFRMLRLLATYDVKTLRVGRVIVVPISELRWKLPELLQAIVEAAALNGRDP